MMVEDFPTWQRQETSTQADVDTTGHVVTSVGEVVTMESDEPTKTPKKRKKRKASEEKHRLLVRMLYYDDGLSRLFKYSEIGKDGDRNDIFRLIAMQDVEDVIGKLCDC